MARYIISRHANDDATISTDLLTASNRDSADACFATEFAKLLPGFTLILTDTTKNTTLNSRTRRTFVELTAQREEYMTRLLSEFSRKEKMDKITEFTTRLLDPERSVCDALSWADKIFTVAAQLHIGRVIAEWRNSGLAWPTILDECRDQVQRTARYPERSTSACSNIMTRELLGAWAEMTDRLTIRWTCLDDQFAALAAIAK